MNEGSLRPFNLIELDELIENLEEESSKDVPLHEIAHLIAGKQKSLLDHRLEWKEEYRKLKMKYQNIPVEVNNVLDSTKISIEERERIDRRGDYLSHKHLYFGICENGHKFFSSKKKNLIDDCPNCRKEKKKGLIKWEK